MSSRQAAVAGYFYEADSDRLRQQVDQLLDAETSAVTDMPQALIVPHAGYIYSGSTAAYAYRCLRIDPGRVKRVLLIGPAHRVFLKGMAIPSVDSFATPLGEIPLEHDTLEQLARLPSVQISDEAHREEHCLEVQLPFLQLVLNDFSLVPVVVGGIDSGPVATMIDALAGDPHTLVVISTDLSHFLDYHEARRIDAATCDHILDKSTHLRGEEACGARAINGFMASAMGRTLEISLLHACNSGDTAGSAERVVGYAAFALH